VKVKVGRDGLSRAEAQQFFEWENAMPKRTSDSARILNFFSEADLGKASVLYELVRDVMSKRQAPERAIKAAKRKAKKASAQVAVAE